MNLNIRISTVKRIGPKGYGYLDGSQCGVEGDIFFHIQGHHSLIVPSYRSGIIEVAHQPCFFYQDKLNGEIKVGDQIVFELTWSDEHKKPQALKWCRRSDWDAAEAESAQQKKETDRVTERGLQVSAARNNIRAALSGIKFRGFMAGKTKNPSIVGDSEQVKNGLRFLDDKIERWELSRDGGKTWEPCKEPGLVAVSEAEELASSSGFDLQDLCPLMQPA